MKQSPYGLSVTHQEWAVDAACRGKGPDLFFVDKGEEIRAAVAICKHCPVRKECLQYAVDNHITHGVYGGLPPKRRRHLRWRAS